VILSFTAGLAVLTLVAAPAAAPIRHAAGPVTLKTVKFSVTWRMSHFSSGRLVLAGKATQAAKLNFGWFAKSLLSQKKPSYGATGPVSGSVSVKKGKFRKTIKFRASLYPGSFVVMGYSSGASGIVSFPGRTVKMPAPPEGIVVKTTSRAIGRSVVIAKFYFLKGALPRSHRVTEAWIQPNGRIYLHAATVPAALVTTTNAKKGKTPFTAGVWRCVLSSSGRPIAQAKVRVG
jgi:hypothetical protein